MKEVFVKGTVAWTTSYVADGEKKSKESQAEFDRFVKANSASVRQGYVFGGTTAVPKASYDRLVQASL